MKLRSFVAIAALAAAAAVPLGAAAHAAPTSADPATVQPAEFEPVAFLDLESSRLVGRQLTEGTGSLQLDGDRRLRINIRTIEPGGHMGNKTHIYRVNGNDVEVPGIGESTTVAVEGLQGTNYANSGEARRITQVIITNVDGTVFEVQEPGRAATVVVLSTVRTGDIAAEASTVGTILHGSQTPDFVSGSIEMLNGRASLGDAPLVAESKVYLPGWTDDYRLEITTLSFAIAEDNSLDDIDVEGSLLVDEGTPQEYAITGASGSYHAENNRVTVNLFAAGGPNDSKLVFELPG